MFLFFLHLLFVLKTYKCFFLLEDFGVVNELLSLEAKGNHKAKGNHEIMDLILKQFVSSSPSV